jgi:hypothetical protein
VITSTRRTGWHLLVETEGREGNLIAGYAKEAGLCSFQRLQCLEWVTQLSDGPSVLLNAVCGILIPHFQLLLCVVTKGHVRSHNDSRVVDSSTLVNTMLEY